MDDNPNSTFLAFDCPQNQSSYIKVIGVGGGGNNAVNHMFRKGISGVDFIVTNTDIKALNGSPVPNRLILGHEGLGVGGRPERAKKAAEEKEKEIRDILTDNTKMVFITAGMGGGTGTGAAPVIARIAKDIKLQSEDDDDPSKILVVAVVTTPFYFEGSRRIKAAHEGVEELRKYVDSILVINNEKLRGFGNLIVSDAFSMANDVLLTAVKGIAEIITLNAYVNLDFRDVNTVMENSGTALMGIGQGKGEDRAVKAVEEATTSVLLDDNDITGAKDVLLYFSCGKDHEITMDEIGLVTDYITQKTGSLETNVIFGYGFDESLDDEIKITLIATGFNKKEIPQPPTSNTSNTPNDSNSNKGNGPNTFDTIKPTGNTTSLPDSITQVPPFTAVKKDFDDHKQRVPETPVQQEPTQPATTTPTQETSTTRIVHNLYDDPVLQPVKKEQSSPIVDDGIILVSRSTGLPIETAPKPNQVPDYLQQPTHQPIADPSYQRLDPVPQSNMRTLHTPTREEIAAMQSSERIKCIHEILREPQGPALVESTLPSALTDSKIFNMGQSVGNDYNAILNADGSIKSNPNTSCTID